MTSPRTARQVAVLASLPPDQRQHFIDLVQYMGERATNGGVMAEGSVAALINKQSPEIRRAFKAINEFAETPRVEPFQAKHSEADRFEQLGLDPDAGTTIKAAIDGLEVGHRLTERLGGSDANREPEPLNLRDHIAAAAELHTGE